MLYLKLFEEYTQEGKIIAQIGNALIDLKIADTEEKKRKGYMFSSGPKKGEGMLFVYLKEQILTFWMKNVFVPLDILFFDSQMNLVDYQTMFPYNGGEEDIYYHSKVPAKFAIEVPHGWIDKYINENNLKLKFIDEKNTFI